MKKPRVSITNLGFASSRSAGGQPEAFGFELGVVHDGGGTFDDGVARRRDLSLAAPFEPERVKFGNRFTVPSDDEMFSRCDAAKNVIQIHPDVPHRDRVRIHKSLMLSLREFDSTTT